MVFYGYHGVLPEERTLGQRFLVDVEMRTDLRRAGGTDALSDTVNYAEVYTAVRDIVTGPPLQLIESVAERIAAHILGAHGSVESVRVRIRKPEVPLPGAILSSSEVRIERARAETD
ncbi:MAG: dihydroneopterin aldolase [Chloroflexi bacterium]|nr:dihydroneopterin aldolase [Chloroflexota bacterium]